MVIKKNKKIKIKIKIKIKKNINNLRLSNIISEIIFFLNSK